MNAPERKRLSELMRHVGNLEADEARKAVERVVARRMAEANKMPGFLPMLTPDPRLVARGIDDKTEWPAGKAPSIDKIIMDEGQPSEVVVNFDREVESEGKPTTWLRRILMRLRLLLG